MSTKLPATNAKNLIKILEQKGFTFSRQSGSHAIYANKNGIHGEKRLRERIVETNHERCGNKQ